jgi:hypothetical protein
MGNNLGQQEGWVPDLFAEGVDILLQLGKETRTVQAFQYKVLELYSPSGCSICNYIDNRPEVIP